MPPPQHSPIALLALPRFEYSFSDLLNSNAQITDFTRSLIDGIFENIMWFGRSDRDYKNFERTARAAYHFLQEGNKTKPKDIAQTYAKIVDQIIPAINNSGMALSDAKKVPADDHDNRIKKYLESYKVMYEGLLRLICAPVIFAFGIAKRVKNKDFIPDDTGKIGLNTLVTIEKLIIYSDNRLAIGLNSHVRNVYAHENYRILDDAKVELWDPNPYKPKKSWGPEVWPLEKLIELNDQLWINALGIICALVIYDINNRRTATDRGWITSQHIPLLRRDELKNTISVLTDNLGFYLNETTISDRRISVNLNPKSRGIDQDSELFMGYEDHTRVFKIRMWYEEKRIIDQLTRFLILLLPYLGADTEVLINIVSHDNAALGSLSVILSDLLDLRLKDTEPDTINSIRNVFKVDTIGEAVTYVEKKGIPRLVGIVPAMPRPESLDS